MSRRKILRLDNIYKKETMMIDEIKNKLDEVGVRLENLRGYL